MPDTLLICDCHETKQRSVTTLNDDEIRFVRIDGKLAVWKDTMLGNYSTPTESSPKLFEGKAIKS